MTILFVCTGNTCRSPMAEGYFRQICQQADMADIEVGSAGTMTCNGMPVSDHSVAVLRQLGINIAGAVSTVLTRELIDRSDLIIVMTASHLEQVLMLAPDAAGKVKKLLDFSSDRDAGDDVADPVGGALQVYRNCFEQMKKALDNLLLDLKNRDAAGN